jgi:hypothetical protein
MRAEPAGYLFPLAKTERPRSPAADGWSNAAGRRDHGEHRRRLSIEPPADRTHRLASLPTIPNLSPLGRRIVDATPLFHGPRSLCQKSSVLRSPIETTVESGHWHPVSKQTLGRPRGSDLAASSFVGETAHWRGGRCAIPNALVPGSGGPQSGCFGSPTLARHRPKLDTTFCASDCEAVSQRDLRAGANDRQPHLSMGAKTAR